MPRKKLMKSATKRSSDRHLQHPDDREHEASTSAIAIAAIAMPRVSGT